jgi:16S rRNA A1518/A1519 N6-dimethyltransferase RsmA/KsgA/DIM1 with predicted DNA glycosylase/AP lyase activity
MLAAGDFAPMAYALWLRWHCLEFKHANYIKPEDGNPHEHSGGPKLNKILRSMQIPEGSVALDLGVGMGIAALTLSHHFSWVIGVDLSPELIAIAERNITKMQVSNIELHCADARTFTQGLNRVTHVYMFNPFPEAVMGLVVENLRKSLARRPRRLTIIYKNPVCHKTIVAAGFAHKGTIHPRHSHAFAVYET